MTSVRSSAAAAPPGPRRPSSRPLLPIGQTAHARFPRPDAWWSLLVALAAPPALLWVLDLVADPAQRRVGVLFLALITTTGLLAGVRAGIVAGLSSVGVLWWGVFPPASSLRMSVDGWIDLVLFVSAVATLLVLLAGLDRARHRVRQAAIAVESFVEAAPLGIGIVDADLRFVRINPTLAAVNGRSQDDHLGQRLTDLFPGELAAGLEQRMLAALTTGEPVIGVELEAPSGEGQPGLHRFATSFLPVALDGSSGLAVVVQDVTDERAAERRSRTVAACAEALALAASDRQAARLLASQLATSVAPRVTIALAVADDRLEVVALAGHRRSHQDRWYGTTLHLDSSTALTDAARTGAPVVLGGEAVVDRAWATADDTSDDPGVEVDTRLVVALPLQLRAGGDVLGALELAWPEEVELDEHDRALHRTIATLAGGALARIRAVEHVSRDVFRLALDAMLDDVTIGRAVRDGDGAIVDFVPEHTHRAGDDPPSGRAGPLPSPWDHPELGAALVDVVETGRPLVDDHLVLRPVPGEELDRATDGPTAEPSSTVWRVQVVPFGDGFLATSRDVTEEAALRREAEAASAAVARERIAVDLLQQAALPATLPRVDGLDLAACYLPATTDSPVGGDWYDAFTADDGRVVLVVGDVAGHGRTSAVNMLQARSLLRAVAAGQPDAGTIVGETNRMLAALWQAQTFATCIVAVLDPCRGDLEVARAGHPPPVTGSGGVLEIAGGPPLGIDPGAGFPTATLVLPSHDDLVLFSDGLVESRLHTIDHGLDQVAALARQHAGTPAADLCERLATGSGSGERADDVCILVTCRTSRT